MAALEKTAIVTGAGKRVGATIARALLDDGWTVVAHVRNATDAVPEGAIRVAADLEQEDCAERIFTAAQGRAPVRLLINNAARFSRDGFGAFSPAELNAHMAVNLRAPILLTDRLAATHQGGEALVINILDSKLAAPNPDYLSYTLSKQALAGFTELAARALAVRSIRVNAVAPALMLPSGGQSAANYEKMHSANPLRRGVEPDDVVAAIRYLISAAAVTGQTIVIDGGQRFWNLPRDVQFLEAQ